MSMNKRTRERERRAEKLGLVGRDTRTPEQRAADANRQLAEWAAKRMQAVQA